MNDTTDNVNDGTTEMSSENKVLPALSWDIQPDKDLWPAVHSNIRFSGKPERPIETESTPQLEVFAGNSNVRHLTKVQRLWMPMSMAACMLLALGAFVMSSMSFQRAQDSYELQASYIEYQKSQISLIEQQHKQVRAQFTALLGGELGPISPTTVAEVQAVLMTIDTASLELKEAILAQPTNNNYASMLARTYQEELKLLNKFKTANGMSI